VPPFQLPAWLPCLLAPSLQRDGVRDEQHPPSAPWSLFSTFLVTCSRTSSILVPPLLSSRPCSVTGSVTSSTHERKSKTNIVIKNGRFLLRHNTFTDDVTLCSSLSLSSASKRNRMCNQRLLRSADDRPYPGAVRGGAGSLACPCSPRLLHNCSGVPLQPSIVAQLLWRALCRCPLWLFSRLQA